MEVGGGPVSLEMTGCPARAWRGSYDEGALDAALGLVSWLSYTEHLAPTRKRSGTGSAEAPGFRLVDGAGDGPARLRLERHRPGRRAAARGRGRPARHASAETCPGGEGRDVTGAAARRGSLLPQ
jgi:hypothetical protein